MPHSYSNFVQQQLAQASVVIFKSPITEMDALRRGLDARGVQFVEIELGMGDAEDRMRFTALKAMTAYPGLPQVFINGEFAGGGHAALQDPRMEDLSALTTAKLKMARLLGYAGILPMVLLALLLLPPPLHDWAIWGMTAYAAVILTFVGALHWGRALFAPPEHVGKQALGAQIVSVLPALLAFVTLTGWLPEVSNLLLLLAGFMLLCAHERRLGDYAPRSFLRMRLHLGYGMSVLLAVAVVAMLFTV